MIRLLLAACIGVFAGSVLLSAADLNGSDTMWLLPVSAIVGSICFALYTIASTIGGAKVVGADLEAAQRENRVSLARVQDVRATGTSVNDQPVCEIRLLVASRTRPAYETTTRALVNLGRLPSLQRGAVVVVAQVAADRPEVSLVDQPSPEWQAAAERDQTVRAMTSAPVWELPPARGRDKRGFFRIPAAVLVLVAVAAFAGRLYPERDAVIAVATGTPLDQAREEAQQARDASVSIFAEGRLPQVIDDFVEVSGGTQFTDFTFTQTYASAEGPTTPDAATTDAYSWRDGKATHDGAALIQPSPGELPGALFDVSGISWTAVSDLANQAAELTGIDDPDGPSVSVARATGLDGPAPIEVRVWLSDDYRDGYITADSAGTILEMSGGAPGSQAAAWAAAHAAS